MVDLISLICFRYFSGAFFAVAMAGHMFLTTLASSAASSTCVKAPMGSPADAVLCRLHDAIYMPSNKSWDVNTAWTGPITLHAKSGEWRGLAPKFIFYNELYLDFIDDGSIPLLTESVDFPTYDLVVVWNRGWPNLCKFIPRWRTRF